MAAKQTSRTTWKKFYTIQHFGYILDDINENWSTYELALERLKETLTEEIKQYRKYVTNEDEET